MTIQASDGTYVVDIVTIPIMTGQSAAMNLVIVWQRRYTYQLYRSH